MVTRGDVIEVRRAAGDVWANTICACLAPATVISMATPLWSSAGVTGRTLAVLIVLASLAVPLLGWFWLRADQVRLGSDRVEKVWLFGRDSRRLGDISGVRSGGDGVVLMGRGDGRNLILPRFASRNADLAAWVNSLPNLDYQDAIKVEEALEADGRLGASPESRRANLVWIRRAAQTLNWAAIAACLWVFIVPRPYDIALLAALSLPAVAIGLTAWKGGLFTIAPGGTIELRGNLLMLVLGPAAVLALRAFLDLHLLDWTAPLATALPIAVGLVALIWFIDMGARSRAMVLFLLPIMFTGAWGGLVLANARLNSAPPAVTSVVLVEARRGEDPRVVVRLPTMGDREVDVEVRRAVFEAAEAGRPLCAAVFPGRFGWRSIIVGVCRPA